MRRLTTEDQDLYLDYYCSDESNRNYAAASEFLGLTEQQIKSVCSTRRRFGGSITHRLRRPYTAEEEAIIQRNYKIVPIAVLAERLHRSYNSINYRACKRLGLRKIDNIEAKYNQVVELANAGETATTIAFKLHINPDSIYEFLRRHGIVTTPIDRSNDEWHRWHRTFWEQKKTAQS